jgi:hypothetical protein
MNAFDLPLCLHCEKEPQSNVYRLCARCAACDGLRNIYKKRKNWTPEWEDHLQKLAERAKNRLPLFPRGEAASTVRRPHQPDRANRNRRKRLPIYYKLHLGEAL